MYELDSEALRHYSGAEAAWGLRDGGGANLWQTRRSKAQQVHTTYCRSHTHDQTHSLSLHRTHTHTHTHTHPHTHSCATDPGSRHTQCSTHGCKQRQTHPSGIETLYTKETTKIYTHTHTHTHT